MISPEDLNSEERLRRMHQTFAEDLSILAEDYEHFTGISPQDAAIPPNTDFRKSAERIGPLDPGQN